MFYLRKIYLFTLFICVCSCCRFVSHNHLFWGSIRGSSIALSFTLLTIIIKYCASDLNFPKTLYYFRFHWQQLLIKMLFFIFSQ